MTTSNRYFIVRLVLVAAYLVTAAVAALAQGVPGYPDIDDYDPREVAMLPRYCIHTQLFRDRVPGGNNQAEIRKWQSIMGPTFNAMHHYCWGLMKTNRAVLLARSKQIREFYLVSSIQEFDYVLRDAPPDFALRPEILTKKGENLIRLGRGQTAVVELERAIELKPDYWPPYAALSDYFKDSGDISRAREWLEKGMAAAPDVKALKNRLAALDAPKSKPAIAPAPRNKSN
jgi:tetratricopeptide (TPR) repeat protein